METRFTSGVAAALTIAIDVPSAAYSGFITCVLIVSVGLYSVCILCFVFYVYPVLCILCVVSVLCFMCTPCLIILYVFSCANNNVHV